jgi:putative transposase
VSGPVSYCIRERELVEYHPMGRPLRTTVGGYVYHVLNRGNGRLAFLQKDGDYQAFLRVVCATQEKVPGVRLLAYCLMPNHWHLLLWPKEDGVLSDFMHWLTLTHTQRWHAHYKNVGEGYLYQGRFKSFPVEADEHYLAVHRYVERNALRAGTVVRAEHWPWGSLAQRLGLATIDRPTLAQGPVDLPRGWPGHVNGPETEAELAALRRSLERGQPYGREGWIKRTAARLGLGATLRPRGRPKKGS